MTILPNPADVRSIVRRVFAELGVDHSKISDMAETVRLEEGRCLARSYRTDQYLAMWLVDIGLLQFYDEEGNMVRRANLFAEIETYSEPRRMAA